MCLDKENTLAPVDFEVVKNLAAKLNDAESKMLEMPQVECKTIDHFGLGVYMREIFIPDGTLVVGHSHKSAHINLLLKGSVLIQYGNLEQHRLDAPHIFNSPPGRKIVYAIGDVSFCTIHPNPENVKDQDSLHELFVIKSEIWKEKNLLLAEKRGEEL